jgi:hypothetical protein
MKESKRRGAKARQLVLKKDTIRVLNGQEAKALVGGARPAADQQSTCVCPPKTILCIPTTTRR